MNRRKSPFRPSFTLAEHDGFHVVSSLVPHVESVSAGIYIPVGSRYESAEQNGLAHFAEHMIFKGTKHKSALELAIAIEGAGGSINAYTSEDQLCLETRGPAELLPLFVETMCEMLYASTFFAVEIEREREVIQEEIAMYREHPSDHIQDMLSSALWQDHPLGRPITGTSESIQTFDTQMLSDFAKEHFAQRGTVLSVAGNVTAEEVQALAAKHLPKSTASKSFAPFENTADSPTFFHKSSDSEQTQLAIGFRTEGRHCKRRHVLRVLSLLMGETMTSRLFQLLREERGLCYHLGSDFALYNETGSFEIELGLDNARLDEVTVLIQEILADISEHGFTEQELSQALNFADGQARIALESPAAIQSWMGDSLLAYGKIIDPFEARMTLAGVTQPEVQSLAKDLFQDSNLAVVSIGKQAVRW